MKRLFMLFAASAVSLMLNAQSADRISDIISSDRATCGQASYIAATALGIAGENASYDETVKLFSEKGILKNDCSASDAITMKQLAWLCANTWNVEGSLMLKIFKSPRYAFRQMKADSVIDVSADPDDVPDGHRLLAVITDCISKYEIKSVGENK